MQVKQRAQWQSWSHYHKTHTTQVSANLIVDQSLMGELWCHSRPDRLSWVLFCQKRQRKAMLFQLTTRALLMNLPKFSSCKNDNWPISDGRDANSYPARQKQTKMSQVNLKQLPTSWITKMHNNTQPWMNTVYLHKSRVWPKFDQSPISVGALEFEKPGMSREN